MKLSIEGLKDCTALLLSLYTSLTYDCLTPWTKVIPISNQLGARQPQTGHAHMMVHTKCQSRGANLIQLYSIIESLYQSNSELLVRAPIYWGCSHQKTPYFSTHVTQRPQISKGKKLSP